MLNCLFVNKINIVNTGKLLWYLWRNTPQTAHLYRNYTQWSDQYVHFCRFRQKKPKRAKLYAAHLFATYQQQHANNNMPYV